MARWRVYFKEELVWETDDRESLWKSGALIGGHPAWRLNRTVRGNPYSRTNNGIRGSGAQWIGFQRVLPVSNNTLRFSEIVILKDGETGTEETFKRAWFLSFFVRLWVACQFHPLKMAVLARECGVAAGIGPIQRMFLCAVARYWPEVRHNLEKNYDIKVEIETQVARVKEIQEFCFNDRVKKIYAKNPAKAAPLLSIGANIGNRLIEAAMAVEKKAEDKARESGFIEKLAANTKAAVAEVVQEMKNDPKP